jgi:hypothetical protein
MRVLKINGVPTKKLLKEDKLLSNSLKWTKKRPFKLDFNWASGLFIIKKKMDFNSIKKIMGHKLGPNYYITVISMVNLNRNATFMAKNYRF